MPFTVTETLLMTFDPIGGESAPRSVLIIGGTILDQTEVDVVIEKLTKMKDWLKPGIPHSTIQDIANEAFERRRQKAAESSPTEPKE